jgi:hypothetical protein
MALAQVGGLPDYWHRKSSDIEPGSWVLTSMFQENKHSGLDFSIADSGDTMIEMFCPVSCRENLTQENLQMTHGFF